MASVYRSWHSTSVGLLCIDWDERLVKGNKHRLTHLTNVSFRQMDLNNTRPDVKADAVYTIDVLEHVDPETETTFSDKHDRVFIT